MYTRSPEAAALPCVMRHSLLARMRAVEHALEAGSAELAVSPADPELERRLLEQSIAIESLRERILETESNLRRLIAALEQLCERIPARPAPPAPVLLPFEAHLNDAVNEESPERRPRLYVEPEPSPDSRKKSSRFPLNRIFG